MSAVDNSAQDPAERTDVPADGGGDGFPVEVDTSSVDDGRIAQLEEALAKAEQEKRDNWDKFVRISADLENYRKRAKRDLDDARHEAKTRVLKEMLPVVDNLERAIEHADKTSGDVNAIIDGVRLVLRQFMQAFERNDVTPIDAVGRPFDPNLHEAISQQESAEHPPGTVMQALQRGYKMGDRLLRPALVVVSRGQPRSNEDGEA